MSSQGGAVPQSASFSQGSAGIEPRPIRRIDVQDLLGNERELILILQGNEYRLRLTSKGKLILTK